MKDNNSFKYLVTIIFVLFLPLPALLLKGGLLNTVEVLDVVIYGLAIVGGGIILNFAAEVLEKDIPRSAALACIALIVVLPEYVVDIYFAWMAGKDSSYLYYPTANMTGANRLLIGIGWTAMLFLHMIFSKLSKNGDGRCIRSITFDKNISFEVCFLYIATLYSFIIPLKGYLSLVDAFILISLCVYYLYLTTKTKKVEEIHLVGPALFIAGLKKYRRRIVVLLLLIYATICIIMVAKPFGESLITLGRKFNINEFLLVQWVAPLASESPELIVCGLFALHNKPQHALGILVSSKVNQWTLLVGMIPLVYSLSAWSINPLILSRSQELEIFLTSAQSLLAALLLTNLNFNFNKAILLSSLFISQLSLPYDLIRLIFSFIYLTIVVLIILVKKRKIRQILNLFSSCKFH